MKKLLEKLKKMFLWYFLLKKRLLLRVGFVLILLTVPLLTLLFTVAAVDTRSGLIRIALANEGESAAAEEIIDSLCAEKGIVYYYKVDSPEEGRELVKTQKADAAWVFESDFEEKTEAYAKGKSETLVTVYECEGDNLFLAISRERIFSSLFKNVAYSMYKNAIDGILPDNEITEEEFMEAYTENAMKSDLIKFSFFSDKEKDINEESFLTTPLRGLLSLVILLCTMASTMYFLSDEKNGTFAFLAPERRIIVFLGTNLSAASLSGAVVGLALLISGLWENVFYESLLLFLYVIAVCGFCTCLGSVVSNLASFAVMLPVVLVVSLIATPVFFNYRSLPLLQSILPPYNYLYSADNPEKALYLFLYAAVSIPLAYYLYRGLCNIRLGRLVSQTIGKN